MALSTTKTVTSANLVLVAHHVKDQVSFCKVRHHFPHITSKQIIARVYHNTVFQEMFALIVLLHLHLLILMNKGYENSEHGVCF